MTLLPLIQHISTLWRGERLCVCACSVCVHKRVRWEMKGGRGEGGREGGGRNLRDKGSEEGKRDGGRRKKVETL